MNELRPVPTPTAEPAGDFDPTGFPDVGGMVQEETKLKVIAIEGGGDWTDASVEYLVIPEIADLTKLVEEYKARPRVQGKYISLASWLKENHGAQHATEPYIEIISDD